MPRPPLAEITAERIVLLKPSALGDIVHSLPVLSAVRCRFPKALIAWVVNRAYAPLLAGHPDLSEVLPFDRTAGFREVPGFVRRLRREQFDLVVDLQGLLRTGVMALATRAPRRVGLATAREGSRLAYTDVIAVPGPMHAVERYWLVAEALGAGMAPKRFHIPIDESALAWANRTMSACPRPWLAVAAGSRWPTKRWPAEHFAALASRAQRNVGGTVVLVGTRDECGISHAVTAGLTAPALDLTGQTTLPQLAALLSLCDVMLANDTGPMHLAAALGRPIVAPYTCTQVRLHGPYGQSGAVESRVWCQGSYVKRCRRLDCMRELTPDRLWPRLDEVLTRWSNSSRSA